MYFLTIMLYLLWISMAVVTLFAEHFCGIMAGQGIPIAGLMLPTRLVTSYSVLAVLLTETMVELCNYSCRLHWV